MTLRPIFQALILILLFLLLLGLPNGFPPEFPMKMLHVFLVLHAFYIPAHLILLGFIILIMYRKANMLPNTSFRIFNFQIRSVHSKHSSQTPCL
jgi:hypothetical protein